MPTRRSLPQLTSTKLPVPYVAFACPGNEAGVAEKSGLLISRDACDRDGDPEQVRLGNVAARRDDLRQELARDAEERQELIVPVERLEAEEHRARRVGRIGHMHARLRSASRSATNRPSRTRGRLAGGSCARASTRASPPRSRGPGGGRSAPGSARRATPGTARPYGGPARRSLAGPGVRSSAPRGRSSPADWRCRSRRARAAPIPASRERGLAGVEDALPDLLRVVLDPARLREVLGDLPVASADDLQLVGDDEAGRSGRALIDRQEHRRSMTDVETTVVG